MAKTHIPQTHPKERDPLSRFIHSSNTWVQAYFKYVLGLIMVCVIGFGLVMLYQYLGRRTNQQAMEELYTARSVLVLKEKEAGGELLSEKPSTNFFRANKKASTYTEDMKKQVAQYRETLNKWKHQPAGMVSSIELAYFLYEYDQKKEALDVLKVLDSFYRPGRLFSFLLAFQAGTYWMDQGEFSVALGFFKKITQDKKARWLWPSALIKMGLIYEHLNKWEQAKTMYKMVQEEFPDSQASVRAEQYLNWLIVKGVFQK